MNSSAAADDFLEEPMEIAVSTVRHHSVAKNAIVRAIVRPYWRMMSRRKWTVEVTPRKTKGQRTTNHVTLKTMLARLEVLNLN